MNRRSFLSSLAVGAFCLVSGLRPEERDPGLPLILEMNYSQESIEMFARDLAVSHGLDWRLPYQAPLKDAYGKTIGRVTGGGPFPARITHY